MENATAKLKASVDWRDTSNLFWEAMAAKFVLFVFYHHILLILCIVRCFETRAALSVSEQLLRTLQQWKTTFETRNVKLWFPIIGYVSAVVSGLAKIRSLVGFFCFVLYRKIVFFLVFLLRIPEITHIIHNRDKTSIDVD